MRKLFFALTLASLGMLIFMGGAHAAKQLEPHFAMNASQVQIAQTVQRQPKLRGIPLSCYVRVGPPTPTPGPIILMQEVLSGYWADVALAYAKAGQFEQAAELTQKMDHPDIPNETLVEIARLSAAAGDYDEALQVLEKINYQGEYQDINARYKAKGLAIIAHQYAAVGNQEKANQTFSEAIAFTRNFTDYIQATSLAEIAIEYAAADEFQQAVQLAQIIEDETYKTTALAGIAKYANLDQLNQLVQLTQTIPEDWQKSSVLAEITNKYIEVGQLDQAVQLAQIIEDEWQKGDVLAEVAGKYVATGEFEQAMQLVQTLPDNSIKEKVLIAIARQANVSQLDQLLPLAPNESSVLAEIAGKYVALGQFDQAAPLAQNLVNVDSVLPTLIEYYAASGRFDLASELANSIEDKSGKTQALLTIANEYVTAKQYDRALQFTDTIESQEDKNRVKISVLRAIASQYAEAGQYQQALEYARQALELAKSLKSAPATAEQEFIGLSGHNLENHYIPLLNCAMGES